MEYNFDTDYDFSKIDFTIDSIKDIKKTLTSPSVSSSVKEYYLELLRNSKNTFIERIGKLSDDDALLKDVDFFKQILLYDPMFLTFYKGKDVCFVFDVDFFDKLDNYKQSGIFDCVLFEKLNFSSIESFKALKMFMDLEDYEVISKYSGNNYDVFDDFLKDPMNSRIYFPLNLVNDKNFIDKYIDKYPHIVFSLLTFNSRYVTDALKKVYDNDSSFLLEFDTYGYIYSDFPIDFYKYAIVDKKNLRYLELTSYGDDSVFQYLFNYIPDQMVDYYCNHNISLFDLDFIKDKASRYPSLITLYFGDKKDLDGVILDLIEKDYNNKTYDLLTVLISRNYCLDDETILNALYYDPQYIKLYRGDADFIYKKALEDGYKFTLNDLKANPFLLTIDEIAEDYIKAYPSLVMYSRKEDIEVLCKKYNINTGQLPINLVSGYNGNKESLFERYDQVVAYLSRLGISKDKFEKYAFYNSFDWLSNLSSIMEYDADSFENVYKFFDKFLGSSSDIEKIDNLIKIIQEYSNIPSFLEMVSKNKEISNKDRENILFVFNNDAYFYRIDDVNSLEELDNVINERQNSYVDLISSCTDINELKDLACEVFFGKIIKDCKKLLKQYGDVTKLRQLEFTNKNNPDVVSLIEDNIVTTAFLSDILDCSNENIIDLRNSLIGIVTNDENYKFINEIASSFGNYEANMKKIYKLEANSNLTKLDNLSDKYIDKSRTNEYGVLTYDLSNTKYNLLGHSISSSETIDEIMSGQPREGHNYISFYSIGNRGFSLLTDNYNVLFGYDNIFNNYLIGSRSNLYSNYFLKYNTTEEFFDHKYESIVEIADTNSSSEVLCYREGIVPSCLIIPKDHIPTDEEINIAKKYNLPLVIVQKVNTKITNPEPIVKKDGSYDSVDYEIFKKQEQINNSKKKKRKVAVLTDIHGLFEPTLAILEDARKQGISEIYSLGDNIGNGPNPNEVLNLLDSYNVKSVMGNHELYAINGVDEYKDHLVSDSFNSALKDSSWTKSKLSSEQLRMIKAYPKSIQLALGNKKVLLTHYVKDYNTEQYNVDKSEYDYILQGHEHFKHSDQFSNVITLRGAGIGGDGQFASYVVLEEDENGFNMVEKHVPFDYSNLRYDIDTSDSPSKDKISSWTGR